MTENNNGTMKAEHKIVLAGVETANTVFDRIVSAREVADALTEAEKESLRAKYVKPLILAIGVILELLATRGLVFIKKGSAKRYYGATSMFDATECELPAEAISRRRIVLQAVREAVQNLQRPVHAGNVYEYTEGKPELRHLTKQLVVRDMNNLAESGELRIVGFIHGDGSGSRLYVPAELIENKFLPPKPLTWLELVDQTFYDIWSEKAADGFIEDRKPYAISTVELRTRLESVWEPHERLQEPRAVTNALKHLSETGRATIRRINTQSPNVVFWCPASTSPDDVTFENLHATDSQKVAAAVRRAYDRWNRPVTAAEVQNEIKRDSLLSLRGRDTAARVLSDAGKKRIGGTGGRRTDRVEPLAQRVDVVSGSTYYCPPGVGLGAAREYTLMLRLSEQWNGLVTSENIELFDKCRLRSAAAGRARVLLQDACTISSEINGLTSATNSASAYRQELVGLNAEIGNYVIHVEAWLNDQGVNGLPAEANEGEALTAKGLLELYSHLYPHIEGMHDPNKLITLLSTSVRRVKNPEFTTRFSKDATQAASYLFDKTDALIHAALKWGGSECRFQALQARDELGALRDYRFILPALQSREYDERLTAVACLAFLPSSDTAEHLRSICLKDKSANVRKSALWAYAFTGGHDWQKLAKSVEKRDADSSVKSFAETLSNCSINDLWYQ